MKSSTKKTFSLLVKLSVLILAYIFFTNKILEFNHWGELRISSKSNLQYIALLCAFLLMPINLLFEAIHWNFSISKHYKTSLLFAFKTVLGGMVPGIISPGRIGEWPGRAYFFEKHIRSKIGALAAFSGIIKTITLCMWGTFALLLLYYITTPNITKTTDYLLIPSVVITLTLCLLFVFSKRISKYVFNSKIARWLGHIKTHTFTWMNTSYITRSTLLASMRAFVFYVQFFLVVYYMDFQLGSLQIMLLTPVYFMSITLLPAFTLAEPAIRGSMALLIFSGITANATIIGIAAVVLWLINNAIALVLGSIIWLRRS